MRAAPIEREKLPGMDEVALSPRFRRLLNLAHSPDRVFVMNYDSGEVQPTTSAKASSCCVGAKRKNSEGVDVIGKPAWFRLSREEALDLWPLHVQFIQLENRAATISERANQELGKARRQYGELPPSIHSVDDLLVARLSGQQAEAASALLAAQQSCKEGMEEAKRAQGQADLFRAPKSVERNDTFRRRYYTQQPIGYLQHFAHLRRVLRDNKAKGAKREKALADERLRLEIQQEARRSVAKREKVS